MLFDTINAIIDFTILNCDFTIKESYYLSFLELVSNSSLENTDRLAIALKFYEKNNNFGPELFEIMNQLYSILSRFMNLPLNFRKCLLYYCQ